MLHLGAFLYPTGYHVSAWRLEEVEARSGFDATNFLRIAQLAEKAQFDFVFLPDSLAMRGDDLEVLSKSAIRYVAQLEPITLMSAIAAVTSRIGLVASASTTYNHPFHLARTFASLDHISSGRAGWNLVTSQNGWEAQNFGMTKHPDHADRYARAREFAEVVVKLWDSWDADAFVNDREAGRYFDPQKVRVADHRGEHFRVRGPLHVPRCPQSRPVIFQAGASESGKTLAAECADVVFTAQDNLQDAKDFRAEIQQRALLAGRNPDSIKVMPGLMPVLDSTDRGARAKFERLEDLIDPATGLSLLEGQLGEVDISQLDVEAPVPATLGPTNASKSRQSLLLKTAAREGLSLRDLYRHVASSRGHKLFVGTADAQADMMQQWYEEGAADGFNIIPAVLPQSLESFVELCLPILQRRGLVRTSYTSATLRDHLCIPSPVR